MFHDLSYKNNEYLYGIADMPVKNILLLSTATLSVYREFKLTRKSSGIVSEVKLNVKSVPTLSAGLFDISK